MDFITKEDHSYYLKIFTLGRFSLLRKGKPLRFNNRAPSKPLELLKTLIVFGGREVSKYRLADTLWAETDGDKSQRALKTNIHRLRKIAGSADVIKVQDHKLTLDANLCWVDVWVLERLLGKITAVIEDSTADDNKITSLAEKILNLYKGAFLKEEDNMVFISYRERLKKKFLQKLRLLGQFFEKRKLWDKAVDIYTRALKEDKLIEEFYQRLMLCYYQQGFRAEALLVYNDCCSNLQSTLGIEPSIKTQAIRNQIIQ